MLGRGFDLLVRYALAIMLVLQDDVHKAIRPIYDLPVQILVF